MVAYQLLSLTYHLFVFQCRLSEAQHKQEEYATNIEKFLNLIQTLNDHKAELTNKVETLTIEKSTTEQEMEDYSTKIEQLRQTINSQELSQEDVRRMEREKTRVEEQISKQSSVLEGQVAALKEAQEKWCAIYQLLEQKVKEYNGQGKQLELIPKNAKHAKGNNFEVKLDKKKAVEGMVNMMGGVDVEGVVKPHVEKLTKGYESETVNEKSRMVEVKESIESTESSNDQLMEDIDVSFYLIHLSCDSSTHAPHRFMYVLFHKYLLRPSRTKSHPAQKNARQVENGLKMISRANAVS